MFWSKKNKAKKAEKKKQAQSQKVREEAMANMQTARETLGDETIARITAAMTKKQQSTTEQARREIQDADPDKVLDELKFMLDQKDKY